MTVSNPPVNLATVAALMAAAGAVTTPMGITGNKFPMGNGSVPRQLDDSLWGQDEFGNLVGGGDVRPNGNVQAGLGNNLGILNSTQLFAPEDGVFSVFKNDGTLPALLQIGGVSLRARTITAAPAIVNADFLFLCNTNGGSFDVTLPVASLHPNRVLAIKLLGSNSVSAVSSGSNTIDGATSLTLTSLYETALFQSDGGSAWNILARHMP